MKVLGFDSTSGQCAAAVLDGERVAAVRAETMTRGQAERLLPLIGETLAEAGLAPAALDLIAVTTGPGSFTGIRIGLAAARGLALATERPAIGIGVFDVFAAAVPPSMRRGRTLVIAVESKRAEFFLQAFAPDGRTLSPAAQLSAGDVDSWLPGGSLLLAGDAAMRLYPLLAARDTTIVSGATIVDAVEVARLGGTRHAAGNAAPPRPFYLRAADTTMPRRPSP